MKNRQKKWFAWVLVAIMALGCAWGAQAEGQNATSDFEILEPLMDLVSGAALVSHDDPQPVPGADGMLDAAFVKTFFLIGETTSPSLGITEDMFADPGRQAEYLGKVFAAKAPELEAFSKGEPMNGYIGFRPVTVNTAAETGGIQIMGEIYWAARPIKELSDAEYSQVQWLERAIFTFQQDGSAMNGFRLAGFSVGTELNMEFAMQNYFDDILVEYVNTMLGFSVQYPSVFTDELLVEDGNGVSATLPDHTASFFAKRIENADRADLASYASVIASGIPGASFQVNEELQYATVTYVTAEGNTIFDVYIVTDKYIYQAELSYQTKLSNQYHMFTTYLENTFMVEDVSVG